MPIVRRIIPALAALIALAAAAPASAEVKELGGSGFPAASCPTDCQAIGQVTGYQVQVGAKKNPMQISKPGKIVAFPIRLGSPNKEQTQFFNNLFGAEPQVRL